MSEYPEAFDHMLASWNEKDSSKIREHLELALAPNIRFVDPSIDLTGIDAFEANVHDVQSKIPGAVYSRTSQVDAQHNFYRYHWAIHQNDELILPGFDVCETDDSGLIVCVIGFFGVIPEL